METMTGVMHMVRIDDRALSQDDIKGLGERDVNVAKDPVLKLHIPYPIAFSSSHSGQTEHIVDINTDVNVDRTFCCWIKGTTDSICAGGSRGALFGLGTSLLDKDSRDAISGYDQSHLGLMIALEKSEHGTTKCLGRGRFYYGDFMVYIYSQDYPESVYDERTYSDLGDGSYHHVAFVIRNLTHMFTIYVDGKLMYEICTERSYRHRMNHIFNRIPEGSNKLFLGKVSQFSGYIENRHYTVENMIPPTEVMDVRYYETALDVRAINAIYERGAMHLKGRDASDLVYGSRAGHFTDAADLCGYHCKTTCEFHRDPLALTCPPGAEAVCDLTPPPVIESAVRGPRLHPTMFGTFNLIDSGASSAPGLQFGFVNNTHGGLPVWFANHAQQSSKMFRFASPIELKNHLDALDDLKRDVLFTSQSSTVRSTGAYDYGMVAFKHAPTYHYLFRMNVSANVGSATLSFLTPEFLKRIAMTASPDPDKADLVGLDLVWEALYTADGFEDFDMSLLVVFEKRYYQLLGATGEPMVLLADGTYGA